MIPDTRELRSGHQIRDLVAPPPPGVLFVSRREILLMRLTRIIKNFLAETGNHCLGIDDRHNELGPCRPIQSSDPPDSKAESWFPVRPSSSTHGLAFGSHRRGIGKPSGGIHRPGETLVPKKMFPPIAWAARPTRQPAGPASIANSDAATMGVCCTGEATIMRQDHYQG